MDRTDRDDWAMEQLKDVWKVLFADGKSGKKQINKQVIVIREQLRRIEVSFHSNNSLL